MQHKRPRKTTPRERTPEDQPSSREGNLDSTHNQEGREYGGRNDFRSEDEQKAFNQHEDQPDKHSNYQKPKKNKEQSATTRKNGDRNIPRKD